MGKRKAPAPKRSRAPGADPLLPKLKELALQANGRHVDVHGDVDPPWPQTVDAMVDSYGAELRADADRIPVTAACIQYMFGMRPSGLVEETASKGVREMTEISQLLGCGEPPGALGHTALEVYDAWYAHLRQVVHERFELWRLRVSGDGGERCISDVWPQIAKVFQAEGVFPPRIAIDITSFGCKNRARDIAAWRQCHGCGDCRGRLAGALRAPDDGAWRRLFCSLFTRRQR